MTKSLQNIVIAYSWDKLPDNQDLMNYAQEMGLKFADSVRFAGRIVGVDREKSSKESNEIFHSINLEENTIYGVDRDIYDNHCTPGDKEFAKKRHKISNKMSEELLILQSEAIVPYE